MAALGGPKKNITTNDLLITIVNEKTVEGFNYPFDGDQLASLSNEGTIPPPTVDCDATFIAELNHQDIEIISEADIADPSWQHYKPADLQKPTAQPLVVTLNKSEGESNKKHKYDAARRRPALSFVANSHISEKYNTLLDHRIHLTEQEVQKSNREEEEGIFITQKHKLEIEAQQLKINILKVDKEIKKYHLQNL